MRSLHLRIVAAVVAVAAALASQTAAGAARKPAGAARTPTVPSRFVGMNLDGPLVDKPVNLPAVLRRMVSSGVGSVRVVFDWAQAQPQQAGPIDFSQTDRLVSRAAVRGLTVLPVIIYAPAWDSAAHVPGTYAPPADDGPYAAYAAALVHRYGPRGSFWSAHRHLRRLPIRRWQIWNEPNFRYDWDAPSFARGYVKLLRAAHAAIKHADRGAKVVLAGFPDQAWDALNKIYKVKGARGAFDIVAAHPYTSQPKNVIRFLQLVRRVMKRHGDGHKPLLVTETGWNSSIHHHPADNYCCQTTAKGQARKLKAVLPLLAANRRALHLDGFYYYTWAGQEFGGAPSFNFAGLFRYTRGRLVAKPAYAVFRKEALALEHCRRKGATPTRCRRRG